MKSKRNGINYEYLHKNEKILKTKQLNLKDKKVNVNLQSKHEQIIPFI